MNKFHIYVLGFALFLTGCATYDGPYCNMSYLIDDGVETYELHKHQIDNNNISFALRIVSDSFIYHRLQSNEDFYYRFDKLINNWSENIIDDNYPIILNSEEINYLKKLNQNIYFYLCCHDNNAVYITTTYQSIVSKLIIKLNDTEYEK